MQRYYTCKRYINVSIIHIEVKIVLSILMSCDEEEIPEIPVEDVEGE
jgi:hypothetical protein